MQDDNKQPENDSKVQIETSIAFDEGKQLSFLGWLFRDPALFAQASRIVKPDWFTDIFARKAYKAMLEIGRALHRQPEPAEVHQWRGLSGEDSRTRDKIEQVVSKGLQASMGYGLDLIRADMQSWLMATLFVETVQKSVPVFNSKDVHRAVELMEKGILKIKASSFADGLHQGFSDSSSNMSLERADRLRHRERILEYGVTFLDDALCGIRPTELIILGAKAGCHAPGQKIRMFDGSVKEVKDVVSGDLLMGPDGTRRVVTGLIAGNGMMYRISPTKGEPFVVNGDHVLKVAWTEFKQTRFVTVEQFLAWPVTHQKRSKLIRSRGIEYKESDLPIDPYFLGVLLGDGSLACNPVGITTKDPEILREIENQAELLDLRISKFDNNGKRCPTYYLPKRNGTKDRKSSLGRDLESLGLLGKRSNNKFIPDIYKKSGKKQRLDLLAGLIDTDGSLGRSVYDYISKSKQLSFDVCELSRSLGLAAYVSPCIKTDQNGVSGEYWRVSISGNTEMVPCRIERKKAKKRTQKKSVLRTGFTVEAIGEGAFYGFELSDDGEYLLEDFTETHNSGKTQLSLSIGLHNAQKGKRVHMFALEADQYEIERRIKYSILANYYYSSGNHKHIDYGAWLNGELEDELGPLEDALQGQFEDAVKNLHLLYRRDGMFDLDALKEELLSLVGKTDLIILDHLHYIDTDGDEENRVYAEAIKTIRDIVLRYEIPVIVVCHLRKDSTFKGTPTIVPKLEDFHGTSNIGKIATTAIMLGRAFDREPSAPGYFLQPTYMRVTKSRMDGGRTYFVALTEFNTRTNCYEPVYKLGRPSNHDTEWNELENLLPFQKRLASILNINL